MWRGIIRCVQAFRLSLRTHVYNSLNISSNTLVFYEKDNCRVSCYFLYSNSKCSNERRVGKTQDGGRNQSCREHIAILA